MPTSVPSNLSRAADADSAQVWHIRGSSRVEVSQLAPTDSEEIDTVAAFYFMTQSAPTVTSASPTLFDLPSAEGCLDRYWAGGVRARPTVVAFLAERTHLFGVLAEAEGAIRKHFPRNPIVLEVFRDPEAHDSQKLFVSVLTCLEPDLARERLQAFDREWWIPNIARANGDLAIGLEFT